MLKAVLGIIILIVVLYSTSATSAVESSVANTQGQIAAFNINNSKGLVSVLNRGADLVHLKYIGWSENWKWDSPKLLSSTTEDDHSQTTKLRFVKQNVDMQVSARAGENKVIYKFKLKLNEQLKSTVGGGVEFNLNPHLDDPGRHASLLPQNSGWSLPVSANQKVRVEFTPSIASIYFERDKKNRIRAFFFDKHTKQGLLEFQMEITLPENSVIAIGENSDAKLSDYESKLGLIRHTDRSFEPSLDLSYLNHQPAGKYGFVSASGNKLIFENQQEARFYGVNIQANSLFISDKQTIRKQAKKLAKLGFNLVRLHHHDSAKWVKNSLIKDGRTTQTFNKSSLESYHWWIKCLKDEGIYVWLDLQVSRPWRKGDRLPGWTTDFKIKNGMSEGKGLIYLNRRMIELSKQFNEALLLSNNPYTNTKLIDEASVMGVMITNENDLTFHYGNQLTNNKKRPFHSRLFEDEINKFKSKLPFWDNSISKTWLPGSSKLLLNDLEARFNLEMISHLKSIGVKVPISTTSIWGGKTFLYSLPSLTTGDIIDVHSYAGGSLLSSDPNTDANFIHSIAYAQVPDKPFSVTEYNTEEKHKTRNSHIIMPYMAAHAAFQNWDAIMLYGYSQDSFRANKFSPWSSHNNPSIMNLAPASALLYRTMHVSSANEELVISGLDKTIFDQEINPKNSLTYRTASELHGISTAMPSSPYLSWLKPSQVANQQTKIQDLNKRYLNRQSNTVRSDTGELARNWQSGVFTINTPKSQGAVGASGSGLGLIELENVSFKVNQKDATILFTSLDEQPLKRSRRILLTTAGKVNSRRNDKKITVISDRITGDFQFSSEVPSFSISTLNGYTPTSIELTTTRTDNGYIHNFRIPPLSEASMYEIVANRNNYSQSGHLNQ